MGICKLSDVHDQMLAFLKEAGLFLTLDSDALSDIELVDWAQDLISKLEPEIKSMVTGAI